MENKEELVGFRILSMEYQTKITKKYANRKPWKAPDPREIISHIPGTVLKINVKVGDKVKMGKSLLMLEAMKIENQIASPFDGVVKDICVKKGDKIHKGTVMIVVEPDEKIK